MKQPNKLKGLLHRLSARPRSSSRSDTIPIPTPGAEPAADPVANAAGSADVSLWEQAFERLKVKNSDLCLRYLDIVQDGGNPDPERLKQAAKDRLKDFEEASRWSVYTERVAKALEATKSLLSLAPDPYSSIAGVGMSILLPLLLNTHTEQDALAKGLAQLPLILLRARYYERQLNADVLELYTTVLEFVIRAVCQRERSGAERFARYLVKADDWRSLIQAIVDQDKLCRETCSVINEASQTQGMQEMEEKWEALEREREEQKRIDCHRAFSFDYLTQKNYNPPRAPQTCEWFLSSPVFVKWQMSPSPSSAPSRILWVNADPGTGKSTLSRALIDESLVSHEPATTKVCFFFFKDDERNNNVCNALLSVLHQIFIHDPRLIRHARDTVDVCADFRSSFSRLWSILEQTVNDPVAGEVVILLDALDECEADGRGNLAEHIRGLTRTAANLKFIITSRPLTSVKRSVDRMADESVIELAGTSPENVEAISKEIERVIRAQIRDDIARRLKLDAETGKSLLEGILAVPNRTYLWVHLVFRDLRVWEGGTNRRDMDRFVENLPRGLPEYYRSMLEKSPDRDLAMWMLKAVLGAKRLLSVKELKDVRQELDRTDEEFKQLVRNACGMTITFYDNEAVFLHQSVKDFVLMSETLWSTSISEAELQLAEVCAEYLRRTDLDPVFSTWLKPSNDRDCIKTDLPFAAYAGEFWLSHVRDAGEDRVHASRMLELLSLEHCVLLVASMSMSCRYPPLAKFGNHDGVLPIHLLSTLNLPQTLKRYLSAANTGFGTPQVIPEHRKAFAGCDAFGIASERDNKEAFELILNSPHGKAALTTADRYDDLPIHTAAQHGRADIVKLILCTPTGTACLHEQNFRGRTPINLACHWGRKEVVELILDRPEGAASLGIQDGLGMMPIHYAGRASLKALEIHGETPLHIAAEKGEEGIVRLILDIPEGLASLNASGIQARLIVGVPEGAETVRRKNDRDETPLDCALAARSAGIVKVFVDVLSDSTNLSRPALSEEIAL